MQVLMAMNIEGHLFLGLMEPLFLRVSFRGMLLIAQEASLRPIVVL